MRNFFLFGLALALVLVGVIVFGYVPRGLTTPRYVEIGKVANLTSFESTDSNVVEVDGVRFETLVPERVLPIPANRPDAKTPVKLGLRITNQTQKPVRFTRYDTLFPELLGADGRALQLEGARNWSFPPTVSDCPLLQPGESATFFLDAKLFWQNNKLQLGGSDGFGGFWYFDDLKPGTYRIQIGYSISSMPGVSVYDPEIQTFRRLTDLWRVPVATPLVEIHLVQR